MNFLSSFNLDHTKLPFAQNNEYRNKNVKDNVTTQKIIKNILLYNFSLVTLSFNLLVLYSLFYANISYI